MQPLISVIIPVYNVEKYLPECLDSVIGQTYENLEIICVNDGSTDKSLDILREYERKDSRIKIIDKKNEGVSIARNTGLDTAKGEYVHFLDSDDYIERNLYEETLSCFAPDIDVVWFEHCFIYRDGNKEDGNLSFYGKHQITEDLLINSDHTTWNKIFRCSTLKKSGIRFPEHMIYEDMAFHWNLFPKHIKKAFLINKKLYNYRCYNTGITNKTANKKEGYSINAIFILDTIYDSWKYYNILQKYEHIFIKLCERNFKFAVQYAPSWEVVRCYWEMTKRLHQWILPLPKESFLNLLYDGKYEISLNHLIDIPPHNPQPLRGFSKYFSIRREGNHNVVRLFTFKIGSRRIKGK